MYGEIKPGMMKNCVIGNIANERIDENGVKRYGTASFPGGRKVYISRYFYHDEVVVMGRNRFKHFTEETVPLTLIDHIRPSKSFEPSVIARMENTDEFPNKWWLYKKEDQEGSIAFAERLKSVKGGDEEAWEQYYQELMAQYA